MNPREPILQPVTVTGCSECEGDREILEMKGLRLLLFTAEFACDRLISFTSGENDESANRAAIFR